MSLQAMVRSLFVRVADEAHPGRAILEADAPGLWAMAREVAAEVGTRPIDEIWLTPGTELAVFERGSTRQRLNDLAPRALLLGAGILDGFEQGAFRSVLAHEYGHFAHRDTAGGEVALRVTNGMMTFAVAIGKAGFAVWWNLAFHFIRLYYFLFRRLSHGATRLQEVLADRVAIQHYGLDAFRTGLVHVIRQSILFPKLADDEIRQAIDQKRPLANLYDLTPCSSVTTLSFLENDIARKMEWPTSEDDTHPSAKDRFALGQRIRSSRVYESGGFVWDLFSDRRAITEEMTLVVAKRIAVQPASAIPASVPAQVDDTNCADETAEVSIPAPVIIDENAERLRAEIELKKSQLSALVEELMPLKVRRKYVNICAVVVGGLVGAIVAVMIFPGAIVLGALFGVVSGFIVTRVYYAVNSAQKEITRRLNNEAVMKDALVQLQNDAGGGLEREVKIEKPKVDLSRNLDFSVAQCPSCGVSYRPGDYRSDVEHIYCLACKTELAR
jgi:Zn-dependent protease with chaperone function